MIASRSRSCRSSYLPPSRSSERQAGRPELVEVRKIWDQAPHNAFTDLVRFHDRWFCVFREGKGHVSADGAIRVISSADGREWSSSALVTRARADLRDPKINVTPDGRLMIVAAAARDRKPSGEARHQSMVWFSPDGQTGSRVMTRPTPISGSGAWPGGLTRLTVSPTARPHGTSTSGSIRAGRDHVRHPGRQPLLFGVAQRVGARLPR